MALVAGEPYSHLWFIPVGCGGDACKDADDNGACEHEQEALGNRQMSGVSGTTPGSQSDEYAKDSAARKMHPKLKPIDAWSIHSFPETGR